MESLRVYKTQATELRRCLTEQSSTVDRFRVLGNLLSVSLEPKVKTRRMEHSPGKRRTGNAPQWPLSADALLRVARLVVHRVLGKHKSTRKISKSGGPCAIDAYLLSQKKLVFGSTHCSQ